MLLATAACGDDSGSAKTKPSSTWVKIAGLR